MKIGSRFAAAMITAATATALLSGAGPATADEREGMGRLNLAQVQAIGELGAKERFEVPQQVIVVDVKGEELTREQLEAVLAGKEPDGVAVRLTVDDPRPSTTLDGLSGEAGEPADPGTMARTIVVRLPFDITIVINGNKIDVITPSCTTTTVVTTTTNGSTTTTTTTTSTTCAPA